MNDGHPDKPLLHARKPLGRPRKGRPEGDASETPNRAAVVHVAPVAPVPPRLLDLKRTAEYLGMSEWTVRELEADGVLRRVRVPLGNGGELRKLLFDREDLDRLIKGWKDRTEV